jgi:hypothetical protein
MADGEPRPQAAAPQRRAPRGRQVLLVTVILAAVVLFLFPAFVAYRYSAPSQRMEYVRRPWRGWSFALAAVEVPSRSELKTSGMALRKADWVFKGTSVDPREVQLLFMPADRPYTFTHQIGRRSVTSTITPTYKFVWEVQGAVDTIPDSEGTILGMLDYRTGHLLYDIRDDLQPSQMVPEPTDSSSPTPAP